VSRLSRQLSEPWGLVVAGVSGGMAWAVAASSLGPAAIGLGAAVGAAVLGVKAVSGALLDRGAEPPPRRPRRASTGVGFSARAERAVHALEDMADGSAPGPLSRQLTTAVSEARDTLAGLDRLGGQAAAVRQALERADTGSLDAELERLQRLLRSASDPAVADLRRSEAAVRDRIAVRDRLTQAGIVLYARMESVTLGLESLVARVAEVLALSTTTGGSDDPSGEVAELALELEGLRVGLAETEQVSRGALDQAPPT